MKERVALGLEARGLEKVSRDTTKGLLIWKSQELNSNETCQQEYKGGDKRRAVVSTYFVPSEHSATVESQTRQCACNSNRPPQPCSVSRKTSCFWTISSGAHAYTSFSINSHFWGARSAEESFARLQSIKMCIWEGWRADGTGLERHCVHSLLCSLQMAPSTAVWNQEL